MKVNLCVCMFSFPEIPDDTAETNSLLRTDQPPKYSDLTPLKCHDAVLKLAYQFEYDMACYGDDLEGTYWCPGSF